MRSWNGTPKHSTKLNPSLEIRNVANKPGLYANINAKKERIKAGSGEKMRKPGAKGAPTDKAFKESAKTAKKPMKKSCR
jgi:hypothetical protein